MVSASAHMLTMSYGNLGKDGCSVAKAFGLLGNARLGMSELPSNLAASYAETTAFDCSGLILSGATYLSLQSLSIAKRIPDAGLLGETYVGKGKDGCVDELPQILLLGSFLVKGAKSMRIPEFFAFIRSRMSFWKWKKESEESLCHELTRRLISALPLSSAPGSRRPSRRAANASRPAGDRTINRNISR